MGKKGEEIVEAAVVLPLVILTILSMIMIALLLFDHQVSQSKAHTSVMKEALKSDSIFGIVKKGASTSGYIRGTYARTVTKNGTYRAYSISQADAVMLGELAG